MGVVDVILEDSGIQEKFLGITLFALVPNTTEFMNAISFALNGNIALRYDTLVHWSICVLIVHVFFLVWRLVRLMLYKCAYFKYLRWLLSLHGTIL